MIKMCEVFLSYLQLKPTLSLSKPVTCEWAVSSAVEGLASESDLIAFHWFPNECDSCILPSAGNSR